MNQDKENVIRNIIVSASPAMLSGLAGKLLLSVCPHYKDSKDTHFPFLDKGKKVTVKISRAFPRKGKKDHNSYFEYLSSSLNNRLLSAVEDDDFLCNIQQIRKSYTDILWYGIFFNEGLYLYKAPLSKLQRSKNIKLVDYQHVGNDDESQLHITRSTLSFHTTNLVTVYSYKAMYDFVKRF